MCSPHFYSDKRPTISVGNVRPVFEILEAVGPLEYNFESEIIKRKKMGVSS